MTRRGLLSIISSVYDPLGLVAPFLLQGRLLNQDLRRANLGWDEVIPEKIQMVQRFKIFVANRVELIKDNSDESQWHFITSEQNPADCVSRGIDVCNDDKVKRWYLGLHILWEPEAT